MTAPQPADHTELIRSLEDKRYSAMAEQRWDDFEQLCHSNLLYTHSSGQTDTCESYLEKVRRGVYVYHSISHPIEKISIIDDIALVLGQMNAEIHANGNPKTLRSKSLAVWKIDGQEWKFLAYHPTAV